MAGIVLFGGTVEGRRFAEAFQNTALELHICVATEYGASLLPECPNINVYTGRMDAGEMAEFFTEKQVQYCLDATHPYALAVTENIVKACQVKSLPYIRVLRAEGEEESSVSEKKKEAVIYKESIEEAAAYLSHTTGSILLTTGSKELEKYTVIPDYKNRCYARVLPVVSVMEKCRQLGFKGKNLIGMQGPFCEELNYWMMKQLNVSYLVTKDSGKEGGYAEKQKAAQRAGVQMLVVGRKAENIFDTACQRKVLTFGEAVQFIRKQYHLEEKRKVYLIGMGPGNAKQLTKEAAECLKECDAVIGAERILKLCLAYSDKPFYSCYKREEIAEILEKHPNYQKAAIVYSGDIGFYSGAKGMKEFLEGYEVHPVSGISSVIYFLNLLSVPWEQTELISCHGKQANFISRIKYQRWVCILLGTKDAAKQICKMLLAYHMENIRVTVGERLSYPEEQILSGLPGQFQEMEVDPLAVMLLENTAPLEKKVVSGIDDSFFIRGSVPMTKQEIRILSLAKLSLTEQSVVYDIGAGTGSVSIEAALHCKDGQVYAIEKEKEGIRLIQENKIRFGADNLNVVEGIAPECLKELPAPTHVFIGGSSGRLLEIIYAIREKKEKVRFVMNVATLETLAQIEQLKEAFPEYREMEVVQVNIARGRELGRYHLMEAQNPVTIVSFGKEEGR